MPVPDDLLRHVIGPQPYSSWWPWVAIALSVALLAWYAAVVLLTRSGRDQGGFRLAGAVRDRRLRHRAVRALRRIGDRYRAGDLGTSSAGTAASRELRRFLSEATGVPADYMQVTDLAGSEIAAAAGLLEKFIDIQFNPLTEVDVSLVIANAEELILSWT
jgi:hypothetical protein